MPNLQDDKELAANSSALNRTASDTHQADARGVRRSQRFRMRQYINCTSSAYGGINGQMINVSEAGVLLASEKAIVLNDEESSAIVLTVIVPSSERAKEERVRIETIPVWCKKSAVGEQYEIGFKWNHLSVPKRLMIKHWQKYCADAM